MAFLPRNKMISQGGSSRGGHDYLAKLKQSFRNPLSSQRAPVIGGKDSWDKFRSNMNTKKQARIQKKEVKKEPKKDELRLPADPLHRRGWLRRHAFEIYKDTRGRVTSNKIFRDHAELHTPKYGFYTEENELYRMKKDMEKAYGRAKTDKEKWKIKQDMKVFDKMHGLGKK